MKVAELDGTLLDLWVARAEGEVLAPAHPLPDTNSGRFWLKMGQYGSVKECPKYHCKWEDAGPIIGRELGTFTIALESTCAPVWCVPVWYWADMGRTASRYRMGGPTHLIAAMRAYVASKFGDEVPDLEKPL